MNRKKVDANSEIKDTDQLFGVVSQKGWYFETPEELALRDSVPQKCLLRTFCSYAEAESYLSAVYPYNDHLGRMSVRETNLAQLRKEAAELSKFTLMSSRYLANLEVDVSTIGWQSWPESVLTILSFTNKETI